VHCDRNLIIQAKEIAFYWKGPMFLAVYDSHIQVRNLTEERQLELEISRKTTRETPDNIKVELVPVVNRPKYNYVNYPVNVIRQKALEMASSSILYLPLDADTIPSPGLFDYIHKNRKWFLENSWTSVFVIPIFFLKSGQVVPNNKEELSSTQKYDITSIPEGYKDINFKKWMTSSEPYQIMPLDSGFQPFVFGRLECLPPYSTKSFLYYGYDKLQWIKHLQHWKVKFLVIPDHFLVHFHHSPYRWGTDSVRNKVGKAPRTYFHDFELELQNSAPPPKACFPEQDY